MIVNSAMFAYALTQLKFRSPKTVLYFIVMGCYAAGRSDYIPSYITLANGPLDSHMGLVASNAASVFGVFYLRQVFIKVHPSLIEAARIDGAGELKILRAIILPQCRSSSRNTVPHHFYYHHNSYMWLIAWLSPLIDSTRLRPTRHYFIAEGNYGLNWSQIMAASTIAVLPLLILFVICQKTILSGIADNGVKE
ncbi:ABC transporter permease subunit [Vibrio lentus]|nr:ABC transporter permease subunit [Vibrio lentus]